MYTSINLQYNVNANLDASDDVILFDFNRCQWCQ